jgi:hypothetical protein
MNNYNQSHSQLKKFLRHFLQKKGNKRRRAVEIIRGRTSSKYFTFQTKLHIDISWSSVHTLHNKRKYKTQPSHSEHLAYSIIYLTIPGSNRFLIFLRRTNMDDLKTRMFLRTLSRPHVWIECLFILVATFYITKAMESSLHVCRSASPSYLENNRRSTWHKS